MQPKTVFGLCLLALLSAPGAWSQTAAPAASHPLYSSLRQVRLAGASLPVQDLHLQRDVLEIVLEQGQVHLAEPAGGKTWLAVFRGKGRLRLVPATPIERDHLRLLAGEPQLEALEDRFESAVLVGTDNTFEELSAGRTPASGGDAGAAAKDVEQFQELMHKDLRWNFELRVLQDLENPQPPGYFLARFEGERSSKLLYVLDPRGASPTWYGPDESGLYDAREREGGWWYLAASKERSLAGKPAAREDRSRFEPVHYRIDTEVDKGETLRGNAKLRLRALEDGNRVLVLSLEGKLRVREAVLLPDRTALPWIQEDEKQGSALGVVLPKAPAKGSEFEVELRYEGEGVLDDAGGGNFAVGARTNWYPSMEVFSRYATYELGFCVPKDHEVIAVGDLLRSEKKDGRQCSEWRSEVPLAVAGFNYGKFKKLEQKDPDSGLLVQVWRNPGTPDWVKEIQMRLREADSQASLESWSSQGDTNTRSIQQSQSLSFDTGALAQDALADAINSLRVYTAYFGPLPFTRIAITQQLSGFSGQAWPTLVYLPSMAFLDSYQRNQLGLSSEGMTDFIQEIGPHEVAHQWWGHLVGARSYHDEWLAEGFSEFSAALQLEKAAGAKRTQEFWRDARVKILAETQFGQRPNDAGPLWLGRRLTTHQSRDSYERMVYPKGGFVLHMLRMMMQGPRGEDDLFIAMMKDFTQSFKTRTASTEDFQAVVEKHMTKEMDLEKNRKMDWFFRQWVYGTEVPAFELQASLESAGQGKTRLKGSLRQKSVSEGFRSLVPIYLDLGGGRIVRIGRVPCVGSKSMPLEVTLPIPQASGVLINANYDVLAYD